MVDIHLLLEVCTEKPNQTLFISQLNDYLSYQESV